MMKQTISILAVTILLALLVPQFADLHMYSVITTILIWVILGHAWNLLGGFTGQVSFGHAMYLGIGAYTSMNVVNELQLDLFLSLLLGGLLAGLVSIPIGLMIFRLKGAYFGLGTLAIAEIALIIARNWKSVTNGGEGMMLDHTPTFLGIEISSKPEYFFLSLFLACLVTLFCYYFMKTKTGYGFIAIRESQEAAEAMGLSSVKYKSTALFLSAFLAGFGGALYGMYNKFIDPEMTMVVHMSAEMIFITVLGGIGTILGPVIGSALLISLQEFLKGITWLQTFPSLYLVIYGLLIMLVIVYLPGGILDGLRKLKSLLWKKGESS
jgi:branched-chain amino acid transport system permease protein